MSSIKLSICMPTYNFGKFIGETLDSILPQLTSETEVVILDGGSTDNTTQVVESYQKRSPYIRYFRQPVRGGIDKDMHLSVEKAKGEYCWLFSSDDIMEKGAIATILEEIKLGMDLYLCNHAICSLDTREVLQSHQFFKDGKNTLFDLTDPKQKKSYFKTATCTTAFFSFMSALVIKRERWMQTTVDPKFFGSCWAHVARIFNMIPSGLKVKSLSAIFLRKRSFNCSFSDRGIIHRLALAIEGYQGIADTIFGRDSKEAFHIRRALRNEFLVGVFLDAAKKIKNGADKEKLIDLICKTYVDRPLEKWTYLLLIFKTPKTLVVPLRLFYRMAKRLVKRESHA